MKVHIITWTGNSIINVREVWTTTEGGRPSRQLEKAVLEAMEEKSNYSDEK